VRTQFKAEAIHAGQTGRRRTMPTEDEVRPFGRRCRHSSNLIATVARRGRERSVVPASASAVETVTRDHATFGANINGCRKTEMSARNDWSFFISSSIHHHHHTGIYNAPITMEQEHRHCTICNDKNSKTYCTLKAILKRWGFSLFLKTVLSDTGRSSAGRLFHEAGPANEKARSPSLVLRCGVT